MTLRLAHDAESNIEEFPGINLSDVAASARRWADLVENGEWGKVYNTTVVIETDSGVESFHWGDSSSAHERLGLLDVAKALLIRDLISDD